MAIFILEHVDDDTHYFANVDNALDKLRGLLEFDDLLENYALKRYELDENEYILAEVLDLEELIDPDDVSLIDSSEEELF